MTQNDKSDNPIESEVQELNKLFAMNQKVSSSIDDKMKPIVAEFIKQNKFEEAKVLVSKCFRELENSPCAEQILLFRSIIVAEEKHNAENTLDIR